MHNVVLSLGSNVGDRLSNLSTAMAMLEGVQCKVIARSSVYETSAWGNTDQPSFYNQVIEAETEGDAFLLMNEILGIEKKMGRIRKQKWEPRIIDIDILFFNSSVIKTDTLTIPHPHLHERRFVLEPLCEILPEKKHLLFDKTMAELLSQLKDDSRSERLKIIPHI